MNVVKTLMFILPMESSVGGNVYVPPTLCLRPAFTAAHAAAYVGRTGSARTNEFTCMQPVSKLIQDSYLLEVA
jgi:hypothetical protein